MKRILLFITAALTFANCSTEAKKNDIYTTIKNDPLFKEYIERFKKDNIIFSDNSIYFDKMKNREYKRCYHVLFGSETCEYKDHEPCLGISDDVDFIQILENKCRKGKLMMELKEKYPEMNKKLVARLIEGSFENGFAAEMLTTKKNSKR